MLILNRQDVESLLNMTEAIATVAEGFRQLALGNVVMPQRAATPIAPYNGLHLSMPAFVVGAPGALTIKIVTVYPQNAEHFGLPAIQGVLLLHDAASGRPLALMDAEHLTAVRTGAASGVATRYLARSDATTVTIFGAGAQAGPQLEAVCAVRSIRQAYVITRTGTKDTEFSTKMSTRLGIEVIATRNPKFAIQQADILCTATNATTPLFDGAWLKPGTHINAVGAYTAKMRELDTVTLQRSRLFVDHHTAAETEAGDILIPIAAGELTYDHVVGALGDLINGTVAGRRSAEEITLFKSVGLALQDAVTATRVYEAALARGVGQQVDL